MASSLSTRLARLEKAASKSRVPNLKLIPHTPAPDTPAQRVRERLKKSPKPADMAQCPRCGGREFLTTKTGVLLKGGKTTGGVPNLICVHCLAKGERIAI